MIKIITILFLLVINIYSNNNQNKIPKPKIREFNTLKISDLTNRYQINTIIGGNIWQWTNLNNSKINFKMDYLSVSVDKYLLFYNAITSSLKYNFYTYSTIVSLGYKIKLYDILYSKLELKSQIYPYFDLGTSISIGFEFSLFNLLRIFTYTNFDSFIINGKNLTKLKIDYYLGVGFYF